MLTLNYKDVARKNIEMVDKLAIFNKKHTPSYHYRDDVHCAIGVCDPERILEPHNYHNIFRCQRLLGIESDNIFMVAFIQQLHDQILIGDCVYYDFTGIPYGWLPAEISSLLTYLTGKKITKKNYCQVMQAILDYDGQIPIL